MRIKKIREHMKEDKQNKRAQSLNSFNPGRSLEKGMATHSSIILPWDFHGQRRLADYSPQGCKELDTAEWLMHTFDLGLFSLLNCEKWTFVIITMKSRGFCHSNSSRLRNSTITCRHLQIYKAIFKDCPWFHYKKNYGKRTMLTDI